MKNAILFVITLWIPYRLSAQSADTLDWKTRYETRVFRANVASQMACDSALSLFIRLSLYRHFIMTYEGTENFLPDFQAFQRIRENSDERKELISYMRSLSIREARMQEMEPLFRQSLDIARKAQGMPILPQNR
jgi:hypothetical protein